MLNDTEWRAYLALQDAGPLPHPGLMPEPAPWESGGQVQIDEQDAAAPEVSALRLLLDGRRSSRELWNPLDISDLRQTLCLALTSTRRPPLRPYPTSGCCDELGVLLAARGVRGLEEGAYWVVADGRISFLRTASLDEGYAEIERQAVPFLGLPTERPPAVSLFIMADWRRLSARYENCILASALWDCGALYQTLLLAASAVGLNACVSACVQPRLIQAWLQLDHREIGHIGTVALGGSPQEETV